MKETPRIYVADLAAYNMRILRGKWFNADSIDEDSIQEFLGEGKEEWAIHDYDGFPEEAMKELGEYPLLEDVQQCARIIAEYGVSVVGAAISVFYTIEYAAEALWDGCYMGAYPSERDFAEDYIQETLDSIESDLPPIIAYNIDYNGVIADLKCSGTVYFDRKGDEVHVFNAR